MDITEEKLREILDVGKSKIIQINGERKYLSNDIIKQMNEKISTKEGGLVRRTGPEGGLFPFIPILAGIFGATAAAAGTSSGIASTISNLRDAVKKKLEIDELQNKNKLETDKETSGQGLYPYFGKGLKDSILNSLEYKSIEKPVRRKFKELLKKMSKK